MARRNERRAPDDSKVVHDRSKPASSKHDAPARRSTGSAPDLRAIQPFIGNRAVSRMAGKPVQRLLDGMYANENGVSEEKVNSRLISLTPAFTSKHVAKDEDQAKTITQKRIDSGKPASMAAGTLSNTTATERDWLYAIDESTAMIPDQDDWSGNMAIALDGWDAKKSGATVALSALDSAGRTVGGFMKKKGGAVAVDHVSGQ